ncbi:MAG: hypothetical protein J0I99_16090 [Devosia sp.]|uniref:hypothetical protein n=1 Tax=Devosia sp. TaxID=1871048 RepID=UPI001AC601F8|nr:hypothetical protein [Devosia sp.]MBN9317264.1 hypothetical protein [Devosia sp.]
MYNALKTELSELLGITKDALHIHIGLAIFLGVALVFRRSLASWIPWLALLAFELANELMDIFHLHKGAIGFEMGDSLKDILNTMFWPTVVLIAARWQRRRQRSAAAAERSRATPDVSQAYSGAATADQT